MSCTCLTRTCLPNWRLIGPRDYPSSGPSVGSCTCQPTEPKSEIFPQQTSCSSIDHYSLQPHSIHTSLSYTSPSFLSQPLHIHLHSNPTRSTSDLFKMGDALAHLNSGRTRMEWLSQLDTAYKPKKQFRRTSIICTIGTLPIIHCLSNSLATMLIEFQVPRPTLPRRLTCSDVVSADIFTFHVYCNLTNHSRSQRCPHELLPRCIRIPPICH